MRLALILIIILLKVIVRRFVISSEKAMEWLYSDKTFVAVWNKIYRNTLLKQTGPEFNKEIWYGEGMLFNIECLQNVEKVVAISTGNRRAAL